MIFNDSILDNDSCSHYAQKLYDLKSYWLPHGSDPQFPYFHTMGLPIYMDPHSGDKYKSIAEKTNHILHENFQPLYNLLIDHLKPIVKAEKIHLAQTAALPGFHIYGQPMPNGGSIHLDDVQVSSFIDYFGNNWDITENYSFTLCLDLPDSGGGIKIWDVPDSAQLDKTQFNKADIESNEIFTYVPYKIGNLFVMKGDNLLHQIAGNKFMKAGERRTTLQGHLLKHHDGHFTMYW